MRESKNLQDDFKHRNLQYLNTQISNEQFEEHIKSNVAVAVDIGIEIYKVSKFGAKINVITDAYNNETRFNINNLRGDLLDMMQLTLTHTTNFIYVNDENEVSVNKQDGELVAIVRLVNGRPVQYTWVDNREIFLLVRFGIYRSISEIRTEVYKVALNNLENGPLFVDKQGGLIFHEGRLSSTDSRIKNVDYYKTQDSQYWLIQRNGILFVIVLDNNKIAVFDELGNLEYILIQKEIQNNSQKDRTTTTIIRNKQQQTTTKTNKKQLNKQNKEINNEKDQSD